MNAELSNEKFREIELKLKTMTEALYVIEEALHDIQKQSDKALDRGDVAAGRRLEQIQNLAWRGLVLCQMLKKDG